MPTCKFCPQDLVWRKTKGGKSMPLELGKVSVMDKHGQIHSGELVHWGRCPGTERAKQTSRCPECGWYTYPGEETCPNCNFDKRGKKPPIWGMGKGENSL